MMKRIVFCCMFLIESVFVFAQNYCDVLISREGDTIYCNVTKIESGYVYYEVEDGNEIIEKIVHKNLLEDIKISEVQNSHGSNNNRPSLVKLKNYKLGIMVGYSEKFTKVGDFTDKDIMDYYLNLNTGFSYALDFYYYPDKHNGVGLKLNRFRSIMTPSPIIAEYEDGSTEYGFISNNIAISYFGLCYSFRANSRFDKGCFFFNPNIGYQYYRDKFELIYKYYLKGDAIGTGFDIGYDYKVNELISLGLQFSYTYGMMNDAEVFYNGVSTPVIYEEKNFGKISRFDIVAAVRFLK